MKKILLISNRNLYNTTGEMRLVKNRAITLHDVYGIKTDFVVFRDQKVLEKPQEIIPTGRFCLITHKFVDYKQKEREVIRQVKKLVSETDTSYSAIIISGALLLPIVDKIRALSPQSKMIADLHGAYEELIEFPRQSILARLAQRFYYIMAKRNERHYLRKFDGFYVVSIALKQYVEKEYDISEKPFFIIPCGIPQTQIDVDSSKSNRVLYRQRYGIGDDDSLFIYSGGVSPWQCIDESVKMFKELNSITSKSIKLLILSGNKAAISKYQSKDIIIDSYSGDEVRKVLCAGDFAFMLRQEFVTNNVAYPNKFLEYVCAGLHVISTTAVRDIATQIKDYHVGTLTELEGSNKNIMDNLTPYLQDVENRNALLKATSFETTLIPFVNFLEKE